MDRLQYIDILRWEDGVYFLDKMFVFHFIERQVVFFFEFFPRFEPAGPLEHIVVVKVGGDGPDIEFDVQGFVDADSHK
jgi:hypothetical protein